MWLDQRLGLALSAAAHIGSTNKHLISLSDLRTCSIDLRRGVPCVALVLLVTFLHSVHDGLLRRAVPNIIALPKR